MRHRHDVTAPNAVRPHCSSSSMPRPRAGSLPSAPWWGGCPQVLRQLVAWGLDHGEGWRVDRRWVRHPAHMIPSAYDGWEERRASL